MSRPGSFWVRGQSPLRGKAQHSPIEGLALREDLTALTKSGKSVRASVLAELKQVRQAAMETVLTDFQTGVYDGLETARLIAAIHDEIVTALYDFTTTHIFRSSNPTQAERMAVCALGGYGRGEMAPQSDIDLLFLLKDKKGSAHTESVIEYMLYMLWDMGLKVGHSVRTVVQNMALAKEDQTIMTALLDLRFLSGDQELAERLYTKFRRHIGRGKGRDYIAAKLKERDIRHERAGDSRYVIEPNIKEGKGGLRDLHVLYWIARYLDRDGRITDAQRAEDYVGMGLFDEAAAKRFVRAADFLWRTRIYLHLLSGQATEMLSFDRQTIVARKMGYASGAVEEAVEKFMREYFINAREVGALTRIACAKLEAEKAIRLPKGLDALLPHSRRPLKEEGFYLDHGRLMFKDPLSLKQTPSQIMELFEIAGRRNLNIHPDALSAIDFRRNLMDQNFRRDAGVADLFMKILLGARAPYATLKLMSEAGVLGRYIQEFGHIVARTQFNMYHAYTVDEHTLQLINYADDIERGLYERENPAATEVSQNLTRRQKRILYLACLLHDTGKGKGDQCIEGARLARRACRRMGVEASECESVAWLVRHHLDMSETAQRRDISDPQTVSDFAKRVGSQSRLDMLYLLTIVDIRAVGPGVWNDWKGTLLRDLYRLTCDYLMGRTELEPLAKAAAVKQQLMERLPGDMADKTRPIWQGLGAGYWLGFDMADLVRHARFFDHMIDKGQDVGVQTRMDKARDITELWVLGRDRQSLFVDLTGVISAAGAQIVGARLHTGQPPDDARSDGSTQIISARIMPARIMNVIYLQTLDGLAFGRHDPQKLIRLQSRVMEVLENKQAETKDIMAVRPSRRAAAIPVRPKIKIINPEFPDEGSIIIEIEGRDRPGLLYDLAQCLKEEDLTLLSAHIEVVGPKAVDAFYVRPHKGPAYIDDGRAAQIKALFRQHLDMSYEKVD